MRQHIAILPLSGRGHLYPLLPLSRELSRRGYRVSFAATEPFADKISNAGAEHVVMSVPVLPDGQKVLTTRRPLPPKDPGWWTVSQSRLDTHFKTVESQFSALYNHYRADVPDLILYDAYLLPGRMTAALLEVPSIRMSPHFAYPAHTITRTDGICHMPTSVPEMVAAVNTFLARHGISASTEMFPEQKLNIHLIPPVFQFNQKDFDERYFFTGPLLNWPTTCSWEKRSGRHSMLLVSEYSGIHGADSEDAGFFRIVLEAFADTEFHCILSIRDEATARSLGSLPHNVEINRDTHHLEILPYADLSICHAGMGATFEAVSSGVPVLGLPMTPPTQEVAYRICELGLGGMLSREGLSSAALRDTVRSMIADRKLRDSVREMQQVFQKSGDPTIAADRVEHFLKNS